MAKIMRRICRVMGATLVLGWLVAGIGSQMVVAEEQAKLATAPEVPPAIQRAQPTTIVVELEAVEKRGPLAEGVEYEFWTFNGTVPGPFIRVRQEDTIEVHLKNKDTNNQAHSIDLHAVTGPGGGGAVSHVEVGDESIFQWKALNPGLYVYHCATQHIPTHIANGMYGLILVEPKGGMPPVSREFYVMQGEFYTLGELGERGFQRYSMKKAMAENPEYVVFNGRMGSLVETGSLRAKVGETVRLYFGNIGPNLVSSFHIIGEIFDRVYREGEVPGPGQPDTNVQTTMVPAGSASIVEFKVEVPGDYLLVDHSIFRAIERGAVGILKVEGPKAPEIFKSLKLSVPQ